MTKLLVSVVAAGLVAAGAAGCGQPVAAARSEAVSRVEGMLYLDDPEAVRAALDAAGSGSDIERIVAAAEQEDRERADAYWSCAGEAAQVLPGSYWEGTVWRADGSWKRVELSLEAGGTASLVTLFSNPPVNPDQRSSIPPKEGETWLSENVEQVTDWSSDIADRVASRSLLDGQPPHFSPVNKSCTVQFMLTLTTSDGESQFTADVDAPGPAGQSSLILDGKSFSRKLR